PGQVTRGNLDRRDVEAGEEVETVHVKGGRHEMHAFHLRPPRQSMMGFPVQLQRPQHGQLAVVGAGVAGLVGGLGGAAGYQAGGAEGLGLDRSGPGFGGDVDHSEGVVERTIVVHPRLGDDEDPAGHGATSWKRLRSRVRRSGAARRASTIRAALPPSPYGFSTPDASISKARPMAAMIAAGSAAQWITESAASRPFCRSPTFTVGTPREGAS